MDLQQFYRGQAYDIYEFLGCHLTKEGAVFRVFAPSAASIDVTGDFHSVRKLVEMKRIQSNFLTKTIEDNRQPKKKNYNLKLSFPENLSIVIF